ncbi:LysR family transcriptional regulator [Thermosulfurimonas dismutans]|nr:LysR family transcriptional regulator [Thermosulfurimonas dismutans]
MTITLRQLEIFLAVAETGHVSKASQRLFLSQPAVSMAISELENQLGTPLFDRIGRRLVLNDRGRLLLSHAREILRQVENVETLLAERGDSITGDLRVGASTTIGSYLLPYLIGAFVDRYPGVTINLSIGNTEQIESGILSGAFDVGFIEGYTHHEEIKALPWLDDELVIIASPRHPLSQKEELTPSDLEKAKWIVREKGSGTEEIFEAEISKHVRQFNVLLRLGHTEAIKKTVESGLGIACLSFLAVRREIEQGWLVRLSVPFLQLHRKFLIVIHSKKIQTNLLSKFLTFCEEWKRGQSPAPHSASSSVSED